MDDHFLLKLVGVISLFLLLVSQFSSFLNLKLHGLVSLNLMLMESWLLALLIGRSGSFNLHVVMNIWMDGGKGLRIDSVELI